MFAIPHKSSCDRDIPAPASAPYTAVSMRSPVESQRNRQRRKFRDRGPLEQEQDEMVHIKFQLE
jgi:hypothetical protein